MTNKKGTKRTLLMSVLSMLMCVTMLVGSTFAWFTDTVTSGNNKIVAGKLDIALYKETINLEGILSGNPLIEEEITDSSTPLFSEDILWEPGHAEVANLKIQNNGNLALRWQAMIRPTTEIGNLAEVIDVYVLKDEIINTANGRDYYAEKIQYVGTLKDVLMGEVILEGNMEETGEVAFLSIVFKMQESAGNEYQEATAGAFDVTIFATQLTYEEDSFDDQYDKDATPVFTSAELEAALEVSGSTIQLAAGEYTLPTMTAKQSDITIIGTEGAKIVGNENSQYKNITFKNVEFAGDIKATFNGNSVIENCTFTDAGLTPSCTVTANSTLTIENCTFEGTADTANIHFGGKDDGTVIVKNCEFKNGWLALGKGMNVTFENCTFSDGVCVSCYGSYTFDKCIFGTDAKVYINAGTGATNVNITMVDCRVENNAAVTSVCYNHGNSTEGSIKQFTIDGTVYDYTALKDFPTDYAASNAEELETAIGTATAGSTILLAAGEYSLPEMTADQSGIIIEGTEGTQIIGNTNSQYKDITIKNVEFTGNMKSTFNGNSIVKDCTFTNVGLNNSCYVPEGSTLIIENSTFDGTTETDLIHFGGNDGGTIIIKNCEFKRGWLGFGNAMNVTFENCTFIDGAMVGCYGSHTFMNCNFSTDAKIYIHPNTKATTVNVTMKDCSVDGDVAVVSVCYSKGNNIEGSTKQFTIDGTVYDYTILADYPTN